MTSGEQASFDSAILRGRIGNDSPLKPFENMNPKSLVRNALLGTFATLAVPTAFLFSDDAGKDPRQGNWYQWRGLMQDGSTHEKNLPMSFKPNGDTLVWKKPEFASRSTPVIMNGRIYLVCRNDAEKPTEGEKTVCVDANTGDLLWESVHNLFLSDAPAERIGWSSVIADPETDRVYVLGLGCLFQCLDGKTGEILWERSLLEEYGMLSTYGGRTNFPVVFEDLVIIGGVMTAWGDNAVPAHRVLAMDKTTGAIVWVMQTRPRPEDTTYSTPVFTVLNGQKAMVFGAADGALYAIQPRTGKVIWRYQVSPRGFNMSPLVDENGIVYCGHGEQNESDRTVLGAVFALDGNTTGDIKEEQLLWKVPGVTVSRSCPVKIGDTVYFIEDGAAIFGYDAKTGKEVAKGKLGRLMFGSPIVSEGNLFIGENSGIVQVLKPKEKGFDIERFRMNDKGEIFGSFAVSNGRVYVPTTAALYCFANKETEPAYDPIPTPLQEPPVTDTEVAHIQICPAEMMLVPGQKTTMQVRAYNKVGQFLKLIEDAEIAIEGGGVIGDGNVYTAPEDVGSGTIVSLTATTGELSSTSKARVFAKLPWSFDFEDKKVPTHWIGSAYRHRPSEVPDGGNGLVKVSTIPKGTRSQGFIGLPKMSNYTIQGDFYALDTKNGTPTPKMPEMGLNAQRYTLLLEGATQQLKIRTWLSNDMRFMKTVPFEWTPKVWYTMKFRAENLDGKVSLKGKVWKRGENEPEAWTIEGVDEMPNLNGSPGIFGNATDAEFFLDNIQVSANE